MVNSPLHSKRSDRSTAECRPPSRIVHFDGGKTCAHICIGAVVQPLQPRAINTAFRFEVAVQCVHASKRLLATIASVRAQVEVQGLVPLAIVLAGETLLATRPLALEWSLLVVRSQMTLQVEMAGKRAPTARDRADEGSLTLSAALTCLGSCWGRDLLPLDLCPRVHGRISGRWQALGNEGRAARRAGVWRRSDGRTHARLSIMMHASRTPSSQSGWSDGRLDANVEGVLRADGRDVPVLRACHLVVYC